MEKMWITSESVTEGHPDKVADQISDAILDAHLRGDPASHVAVNTLVTYGLVVVAGEVTSRVKVDYERIVRETIKGIGYTDVAIGMDGAKTGVKIAIHSQSPDIAQGVNEAGAHEQGAGDQGMMYGFACDETAELMPLPISLAHSLTRRLAEVRKTGTVKHLRPDGKSQVTIEYRNGKPKRASAIIISAQHDDVDIEGLRKEILKKVIAPVCGKWVDKETKVFINPTGRFVIGGPAGDTGLTGRKIIVDTYGAVGRHGGGAFSGKDPSKVDRSAAYAARWIAKNIVAASLAKRCEVQVSYAIGVAKPVSVNIDTFGTGRIPDGDLMRLVEQHFDVRPKSIIQQLRLLRPIYLKTAAYGHFGRDEPDFTWERTDKAKLLAAAAKDVKRKK